MRFRKPLFWQWFASEEYGDGFTWVRAVEKGQRLECCECL
jgi:hypothetical protein